MADNTKNETPPAAEQQAREQQAPVSARRGWFTPVITAILVAVALVIGGVGGFAIANAIQSGGDIATEQGPAPHVGGPQGPQAPHGGPQQGPRGGHDGPRDGERPDRPKGSDTEPGASTEG